MAPTQEKIQMNIEIYNESSVYGGQERYLKTLCDGLRLQGHRITFKGGPLRLARELEYSTQQEPRQESHETTYISLLNGNRALYKRVKKKSSKRIQLYVQHSNSSDAQAGSLKPLVRRLIMRTLFKRVDAIIRVSDAALPNSWAPAKIHTIHNGVDPTHFYCKDLWRDNPQKPIQLLMVGSINENKNQRSAIEALRLLKNAHLTIVGEGEKRTELEALAKDLGVNSQVTWLGHIEDPASRYREADLLLMLSHFEAMPFVVLEAMASGTPVVAFPVGGVPEVITHEDDGILVQVRSPIALASNIDQFSSDPELLERMGRKARSKIEAKFTAEHMVSGFLTVVAEVLKKPHRARGNLK